MLIYVAGHNGLVGSAITREIEKKNTNSWIGKNRSELDLLDREAVFDFLNTAKPDALIISAAKVGGIKANTDYPVEFLTENLQIQCNLIDAAHQANVERVLFLGSSCIYPKFSAQPIKETELLTGPLEPSNEPYAIAKIAGLKLISSYRREYRRKWISAMPTNVYGPFDNFDSDTSHVLPAMIRKFHLAKLENRPEVTLWGTGLPLREFIYSEDLASALLLLLEKYDEDIPINVGTNQEVSINELAELVKKITKYEGQIVWDQTMPDGTPRKSLDSSILTSLGWRPNFSLEVGIQLSYEWFLKNY